MISSTPLSSPHGVNDRIYRILKTWGTQHIPSVRYHQTTAFMSDFRVTHKDLFCACLAQAMWRFIARPSREEASRRVQQATELGDPATRLKTVGCAEAFMEPLCAENNRMHLRRPRRRSRVACSPSEEIVSPASLTRLLSTVIVRDDGASICAAEMVFSLLILAVKFIEATISMFWVQLIREAGAESHKWIWGCFAVETFVPHGAQRNNGAQGGRRC
jgi:hypothetical protein